MGKRKSATYERFITGPIPRFDERNTAFSRVDRGELGEPSRITSTQRLSDSTVHQFLSMDPSREAREGYGQKDYALRWASRTIDYLVRKSFYSRNLEVNQAKVDVSSREAITKEIKRVARWFGADLVGVCEINPAWLYSCWGEHNSILGGIGHPGEPIELPPEFRCAVVMAIEMDYHELRRSPAMEAATSLAYSQMAFVAPSVATYIRHLGYQAIPSGNDFGLSIPLAVDAGLGELGRNGLLITEQFGSRVRICKVFTELPLEPDSPVDIRLQDFCEKCERCAEACPSGAIMSGDRTDKAWDISNNINLLKWPVKAMNCIGWWSQNRSHCAVCIRVCPWNKPPGLLHSLVRKTAKTTPLFDRFFVKMDRLLGYGKQVIS